MQEKELSSEFPKANLCLL